MAVSVDAKGLAEKVFDSFKKITPALVAISLAAGLILFLPTSILEKMALDNLNETWKRIIGITFVISLALIITIAIIKVCSIINNKFAPKRFRKKMRKQLIALPIELKRMLVNMLNSPNRSMALDPTSGNTLYLLNHLFIHQTQSFMLVGAGYIEPIPYAPEPWLIDLFNKEPDLFRI